MHEKIGSGRRFRGLAGQLAGKPGVKNPAGLAAAIGRKKYGAKRMAALAQAGKRRADAGEPTPEDAARARARRVKV